MSIDITKPVTTQLTRLGCTGQHLCRCSVEPLVRTARTLAGTVQPKVTNTLGGVTHPATCNHDWYPTLVADAGPHAGKVCCTACGDPAAPA